MRAYISFVLVFLSLALLLSLLSMAQAADSVDLSKAVAVSRAYGVQMNVKESVVEAAGQGAREGFAAYDASHDVGLCRHCGDHFCDPLPSSPNFCSAQLCVACFREDEAREEAAGTAVSRTDALRGHAFDGDFSVALGTVDFEVFLKADGTAKNGYALDYGRFRKDVGMTLASGKLGVTAAGKIPAGTVAG